VYSAILDARSRLSAAWPWLRFAAMSCARGEPPQTRPEDGVVLGVLAAIGLTGLLVEAARITVDSRPDFETWSFVGYRSAPSSRRRGGGIHQGSGSPTSSPSWLCWS
jgi:hypothetical protein